MFREFTTEVPVFGGADFNILDFGAVAGGRVSCTEAFARAIEKASEKGGRVIVPNGIFLCTWKTMPLLSLPKAGKTTLLWSRTSMESAA
jgi:polygalacturonase